MATQIQQHQQQAEVMPPQQQQLVAAGNGAFGGGAAGVPYGMRTSSFPNLPRQTSIYSLTLDELQNAIGEPGQKPNFGSMNMDEFLKNIWTAEEQQAMAAAMAAGADQQQIGVVRQSSIQKQNSLTLPRTMSRKTVDEVWRDMNLWAPGEQQGQQRQMTFGEMTLEDFLVKAGVVREELNTSMGLATGGSFGGPYTPNLSEAPPLPRPPVTAAHDPGGTQTATQATLAAIQNAANQQQAEWLKYQMTNASTAAAMAAQQQQAQHQQHQQQQQQLLQQQAAEAAAAFVNAHKRAVPALATPPAPSLALMSPTDRTENDLGASLSPDSAGNGVTMATASPVDGAARGKKRGPGEVVEKVVERRQKRMIKNRESAARSRARKQAYTVELEAEITQLKEDNAKLKARQKEEVEQRCQLIVHSMSQVVKEQQAAAAAKPVLRRTRSGPW